MEILKKDSLIITNLEVEKPEGIIENKELEKDLNDSYNYLKENKHLEDPIFDKVKIKSRHRVADDEGATDIAVKATKKLLDKNPLDKNEKTVFITGTLSAENRWPSSAAETLFRLNLTKEKGFDKITAFDISAACSGWTYGIETASALMIAKGYMSAIVISTDTMTKFVHPTDKTRIIFGDGATAIKIEKENSKEKKKGFRILRTDMVTYATNPQNVHYPTEIQKNATEDQRLRMNLRGGEVYRAGVGLSESFIRQYLAENNINLEEIDYVIPHQANGAMLESLDEVLSLGKNKYGESKLLSNIETTGNTAASSIPLCLFDFQQQGKFKNGDRILMCSFAAGYTLGIVEVEVVS